MVEPPDSRRNLERADDVVAGILQITARFAAVVPGADEKNTLIPHLLRQPLVGAEHDMQENVVPAVQQANGNVHLLRDSREMRPVAAVPIGVRLVIDDPVAVPIATAAQAFIQCGCGRCCDRVFPNPRSFAAKQIVVPVLLAHLRCPFRPDLQIEQAPVVERVVALGAKHGDEHGFQHGMMVVRDRPLGVGHIRAAEGGDIAVAPALLPDPVQHRAAVGILLNG